ncbi:MAG: UDP-glucuronic acid decarboxylase family protein [Pseudomonadota bacterium]
MRHSWQGKSILVTGGAGLVGSFLCEKLLSMGHTVLCLDNFYTGNRANIEHLFSHPNFELIRHNVIEPFSAEIDEIYSCACPAAPIHYQRDPVFTIQTSINGTINMLDLAQRRKAKILLTSTSEVYGDPIIHPQPETYWGNVNPIGIRSCYDEGKRCAETLMFDYHRQYKARIKVARIFNTYGPRMHPEDGRVISNFIMQALQNKPITIYGTGQQTRSFCYVEDLVKGLIGLMEDTDETFTGPMNLGNPVEFTMAELAERVIKITGTSSKITYLPIAADDPKQRQPNISLAMSEIGWQPTVELEQGLIKTISYFDNLLKKNLPQIRSA